MIYNNIPQSYLINNIHFPKFNNQIMPYNNNYYYYNNINNNIFAKNDVQYQNKLFFKKNNSKKSYLIKRRFIDNIPDNNINKEENIFLKINNIKIDKKRKISIDTTVSSNSFNSSTNDEQEKQKQKENGIEKKNDEKNKNESYEGNPEFLNTEILRVKVKISKDKEAVFKIKRYDDVFETIKLFCEINLIDEKLIKPLIIKSLCALNTIYQIMNAKLENEQINLLKKAHI